MRLIDADKLFLILEKEQAYLEKENLLNRSFGIGDAIIELCSAPTVDAVEVVRCGECKYMNPQGICMQFADFRIFPSASDYCSFGERKEE